LFLRALHMGPDAFHMESALIHMNRREFWVSFALFRLVPGAIRMGSRSLHMGRRALRMEWRAIHLPRAEFWMGQDLFRVGSPEFQMRRAQIYRKRAPLWRARVLAWQTISPQRVLGKMPSRLVGSKARLWGLTRKFYRITEGEGKRGKGRRKKDEVGNGTNDH
ncbi:MAG: hypothetical protein ABI016_06540, partial [Chthoniobacterales bacterium]